MSEDDEDRLAHLLVECMALDADASDAFVSTALADAPHLRAELVSLLAVERAAIFRPWQNVVLGADAVARTRDRTGTLVGAYRIGPLLGAGGFGSVHEAQRRDTGGAAPAAIKFLTRLAVPDATDTQAALESTVNARLDHPNITRLLDGGVTADGVPWLVMDLVRGEPIDEYSDRRRLDIPQRLHLLGRVCAAVHHAHQHQVLHLDLKPANILVSTDGEPKLLDFGVAQLVEALPAGDESAGGPGLRGFTPTHASPEQFDGRHVTVGSDVYALGVVLYQLLCGRLPIELSRYVPSDWARAVGHELPPAPSETLNGARPGGNSEAAIAASRSTSPPRLRRQLQGDLDAIVQKALNKNPDERYTDLFQFADDLDRAVHRQPVRARRRPVGMRAVRWIARHPFGAVALLGYAALWLFGVSQAAASVRAFDASKAAATANLDRAGTLMLAGVALLERMAGAPEVESARRLTEDELDWSLDRLHAEGVAMPIEWKRDLAAAYEDLADRHRAGDDGERRSLAALEHAIAVYRDLFARLGDDRTSARLAALLRRAADACAQLNQDTRARAFAAEAAWLEGRR